MEFRRGLRLPPLTKYLKGILEQYPDDGQILKELIQNADDAGASMVRFVLDERTHSTDKDGLIHSDMAKFQGPALLAFNDAVFTEKDWNGICMMQESVKRDDVIKTGRFGLGFKSIFHITDMPSILSGDYVGFIDPDQEYLPYRESAYNWHLQEHKDFIQSKPQQFKPFLHELLNSTSNNFESGRYEHTVFRFPLRNKVSQLSENCYSADKLIQLFDSLKQDGGQSLLFLKHVQTIQVHHIPKDGDKPVLLYSMKVAGATKSEVIKRRQELIEQIEQKLWVQTPVEALLKMTIEVEEKMNNRKIVSSRDWLVYHRCHGTNTVLQMAEKLKVLPWVGVGLQLSSEGEESSCQPEGHLFATLPLPRDGTERTGLPFHIHAYFSMEQNRRHLRWPTSDQKEKAMNSDSLVWNQLLVNECIPGAVQALFKTSIQRDQCVAPRDVYRLIPDMSQVDPKWQAVVPQICRAVFQGPCLYSEAKDKMWVTPENSLVLAGNTPSSITAPLEQILTTAGLPITKPPDHIRRALSKYSQGQPKPVSVDIIRDAMIKVENQRKLTLSRPQRLCFLKYILENGKIKHIQDLPLLPVLTGDFLVFKKPSDTEPVYLSKEHSAGLLPHLQHRMISDDLEPDLENLLLKVGEHGSTQVKVLQCKDVFANLDGVFPPSWSASDIVLWSPEAVATHPSMAWLQQFWNYMHRSHLSTQDWDLLKQYHLLPLDGCKKLYRLSVSTKMVLKRKHGPTLPPGVCKFLEMVGVIVLSDVPECVAISKEVIYRYICPPSLDGVIDAMMSLRKELGEGFHRKVKSIAPQRQELLDEFVEFVSDAGVNLLSEPKKLFLGDVPLFSSISGLGFQSEKGVSVNEIKVSAPSVTLPVPFPVPAIDTSNKKARCVLEAIGVETYHQATFPKIFHDTLLPAAKSGRYSETEVDDMMTYVFDKYPEILKSKDTAAEISKMRFVKSVSGEHRLPQELFDPSDSLLILFLDESLFPNEKYQTWLTLLRKVGLKTKKDVSLETFARIANSLDSQPEKVKEFIKLTEQLSVVQPQQQWWQHLKEVAFLPVVQEKPDSYPESMPWAGATTTHAQKPAAVCHIKFATKVGSVLPLVDINETVLAKLKEKPDPTLEDLVSQLEQIIKHYDANEKSKYLILLDKMYSSMDDYATEQIQAALDEKSLSSWIWVGNGFETGETVILNPTVVELVPFVFSLPSEMKRHMKLLRKCGVRETVTLTSVLEMIAEKHETRKHVSIQEIAHDLQLAITILSVVCKDGEENPLVPVDTNTSELRLLPASECTAWNMSRALDGDLNFVHRSVPQDIVSSLHIKTVDHRFLEGDEFDIESFGQNEPLTRRLRSVLEGYTDGLSILKEMIQNADDAGATEIKLVYDMRENSERKQSLLDPGMAAWQGPALWVYNDAVFTDQDFENIAKLNGATKKEKEDNIGAFGLGFNAVYNLTDVPSILSRDKMVIFDPHTTHLGQAVSDKSKPGLRFSVGKNKHMVLRRYSDQFGPWNGILGCNLQPDSKDFSGNFNGTLFRLPLRGRKASKSSEISNICYNKENVIELLNMIHNKGSSMLLFSQNVVKVSVSVIPEQPNTTELRVDDLFEINKKPVKILRHHGVDCSPSLPTSRKDPATQEFINETSILKTSVKIKALHGEHEKVESSMIISSELKTFESFASITNQEKYDQKTEMFWMVSSCIQELDPEVHNMNPNRPPVAGIAVCLGPDASCYKLQSDESNKGNDHGSYFSFLPLPVKCPLPLQINGTFVLDHSRKYLVEKTTHDKGSRGEEWNKELMEGPVCASYITALTDLIHLLGPQADLTKILPWNIKDDLITYLSEAFWKRIMQNPDSLEILHTPERNVSFHNSSFLDDHLLDLKDEEKGPVIKIISAVFSETDNMLVTLPCHLKRTFSEIDETLLQQKTITEERFCIDFLLPNLRGMPVKREERDWLLMKALKMKSNAVDAAMKDQECIPMGTHMDDLACPKDLIHPGGEAAGLYSQKDAKFPAFQIFSFEARSSAHDRLCELGMVKDDLDWENIIERSCHLTLSQQSSKIGKEMIPSEPFTFMDKENKFLEYLAWKLAIPDLIIPEGVQKRLESGRFLPSAKKPSDWNLDWKSEGTFCVCELYHLKDPVIAGSELPILHQAIKIKPEVARFLGIKGDDTEHPVGIEILKRQLQKLESAGESLTHSHGSVRKCLGKIYGELGEACQDESTAEMVKELFSAECFVLVGNSLVQPGKCAFKGKKFPYMYVVDRVLAKKHKVLLETVGVKNEFLCSDYISALSQIKRAFAHKPLTPFTYILEVTEMLACLKRKMNNKDEDLQCTTPIFVPDANGVMQPAQDLCYDDSEQYDCIVAQTKEYLLTHSLICKSVAHGLGVKKLSTAVLENSSHAVAVEPEVNLMDTIKSTLKTNSSEIDGLFELIKTADRYGATEIHFVLDPRFHRSDSVFYDKWDQLQGPAICVYTDARCPDMETLTSESIPLSIYHLTDTPSVLATLGDGSEVLCAYDPTCQKLEGVSPEEPGMTFSNLELLRMLFPDVFKCYHENRFSGGTVFRFPIWTPEMDRKCVYPHSRKAVHDMKSIKENLSQNAFKALLFLTSLRKIQISKVDAITGKLSTKVITASVTGATDAQMSCFRDHLFHSQTGPCNGARGPMDNTPLELSYTLIVNQQNTIDTWYIVQKCESPENVGIADIDSPTFRRRNNESALQVGIAKCFKSKAELDIHEEDLDIHEEDLPFRYIGCFLQSHDGETDASQSNTTDQWNRSVANHVASAYVTLMKRAKEEVTAGYSPNGPSTAGPGIAGSATARYGTARNSTSGQIKKRQNQNGSARYSSAGNSTAGNGTTGQIKKHQYLKMFPQNSPKLKSTDQLIVSELYKLLMEEEVIPTSSEPGKLKWAKPSDACFLKDGKKKQDKEDNPKVHKDAIKGAKVCGMEIAELDNQNVLNMFETYGGCNIQYFTLHVLFQFLRDGELSQTLSQKVDSEINPHLYMGKKPLYGFGLSGIELVTKMLECCLTVDEDLDGLPLLVTADGKLHVFDTGQPVFKSPDSDVLHPNSNRFLHRDFTEMLKDINSPVFKELDLKAFCEELRLRHPELSQGVPIPLKGALVELWLQSVWEVLDRLSGSNIDALLNHAGDLCLLVTEEGEENNKYCYPINQMHLVFPRTPQSSRYLRTDFPVSAMTEKGAVISRGLASWERPASIVRALHHHLQRAENIPQIFSEQFLLEYFVKHHFYFTEDDKDLLKDLPMFETLNYEHVAIAGKCAYAIPTTFPREDMDSWDNPSDGIVFLKRKECAEALYEAVGCKLWREADLYVEYIFPQLEMLSEKGYFIHMGYVFNQLQDEEKVMEALRTMKCVNNRAGKLCRPCDLYDPRIQLFRTMHPLDLPAREYQEKLQVLEKAGMICSATKDMLKRYAQQQRQVQGVIWREVLGYIRQNIEEDLRPTYLKYLSAVAFMPRVNSLNGDICPENTEEKYASLQQSFSEENANVVWAVAPLITNLSHWFKREVLAAAGILNVPSCELVAQNIRRVCQFNSRGPEASADCRNHLTRVMDECFQYIARKLEQKEVTEEEEETLKDILGNCRCVPVVQATMFVKPCQTVLQAHQEEEVRPYLFRMPESLAFSKAALLLLGTSEVPRVKNYQEVLSELYRKHRYRPITDEEELNAARQATVQILRRLRTDNSMDEDEDVWLLSSENSLCRSRDLLFCDNLAMKDRLPSGLKVLCNVGMVGLVEEVLNCLPERHRLKLLTSVVKEQVAHAQPPCDDVENRVADQLASEETKIAIERLAYHILARNSTHDDTEVINQTVLEIGQKIQSIKVRIVEKLKTCLTNDSSDVVGEWRERKVFGDQNNSVFYMERSMVHPTSNVEFTHIYIYKVLADMVDNICGGMFKEHTSLLMVILSEDTGNISSYLDEMGITRQDS